MLSRLGQTGLSRVLTVRSLLLLTALPLIAWLPVHAGDLGLYDQSMAGVSAKAQRYDQLVFDNFGNKIEFTPGRLEIILNERHRTWMQEKNERLYGNIDFDDALGIKYITPEQVISFDYHVQPGTGIPFKIFYKARNGEKALASIVFRDENTAKSFQNTFLLWLNGKLSGVRSNQAAPY